MGRRRDHCHVHPNDGRNDKWCCPDAGADSKGARDTGLRGRARLGPRSMTRVIPTTKDRCAPGRFGYGGRPSRDAPQGHGLRPHLATLSLRILRSKLHCQPRHLVLGLEGRLWTPSHWLPATAPTCSLPSGTDTRRSRSALPITKRSENTIASAASAGDSSRPNAGYSTPAATGIRSTL